MRLNAILNAVDAVANDIRYHLKCWVKMQQLTDPKKDLQELDDHKQVPCDIELISFIKDQLSNPAGLIMDMNTLNESYKKKLKEFEVEECKIKNNKKPYIKQFINENIRSSEIVKSPRRNEPRHVCSKQTNEYSIDTVLQDTQETLSDIFIVASLIRKEILEHSKWELTGTFDNFQLPQHLSLLIKWILISPNKEMSGDGRERNVEKDISLITQLFMQTIKSNRQLNYQPYQLYKNDSYITRETPSYVELGLHNYQKNSK